MKDHNYFIYILTNRKRTTLYVGMTNDLEDRILRHYFNRGDKSTYCGRYYCYFLVYFERFQYVWHAIEREKEIKKWRREKKEMLIKEINPNFNFPISEIMDWPPKGCKEDYFND